MSKQVPSFTISKGDEEVAHRQHPELLRGHNDPSRKALCAKDAPDCQAYLKKEQGLYHGIMAYTDAQLALIQKQLDYE